MEEPPLIVKSWLKKNHFTVVIDAFLRSDGGREEDKDTDEKGIRRGKVGYEWCEPFYLGGKTY